MAKSKLEEDLLAQIVKAGLADGMVREFRYHPARRWRFDFAWPQARVYCECQGGVWIRGRHSRPKGMLNDMEKFSEASALGWRPVLVTGLEIKNGAALDRIERALAWTGPGTFHPHAK